MINISIFETKIRSLVALLCIAFILQGCATMNEEDCLSADWTSIGERDGARGLKNSMFESRANACSEHGVTADLAAYRDGYGYGIRQYCNPSNGYNIGIDKQEYTYVCPIDLHDAFLREYVKGLNFAISQLELDERELEVDYREAEVEIREAQNAEARESAERRRSYAETSLDRVREETDDLRVWLNSAIDQL